MLNPAAGETRDWRRRWSLLLAKIERVQSPAQGQALLDELSRPRAPSVLAFANAHAMNSMAVSAPFFEAMQSADRVLRDGSGMATLFKMLRMEPGLNLNGTDLIPKLMRAFDGRGIALFGTREPWLEKAWQRVREELAPHSRSYAPTAFSMRRPMPTRGRAPAGADRARHGHAAAGRVAAQLRAVLGYPCLIVCGGAIIDFLGGKTPRAPLWMRKAGLEWVFAWRWSRAGCSSVM
jgi:N-acetylglucosaminyldiphosphoundecaprenol N-acetyl-beta-D-mannosaminyltransferase